MIEAQVMQDFAGQNKETLDVFVKKIVDEIKKQMVDINFKKIDIGEVKQDDKTKLFFVTVVLTVSAEKASDIFKFYSFSLWGPVIIDILSPAKYEFTLSEMQDLFNITSQILTQNTVQILQQQQKQQLATNKTNASTENNKK